MNKLRIKEFEGYVKKKNRFGITKMSYEEIDKKWKGEKAFRAKLRILMADTFGVDMENMDNNNCESPIQYFRLRMFKKLMMTTRKCLIDIGVIK